MTKETLFTAKNRPLYKIHTSKKYLVGGVVSLRWGGGGIVKV